MNIGVGSTSTVYLTNIKNKSIPVACKVFNEKQAFIKEQYIHKLLEFTKGISQLIYDETEDVFDNSITMKSYHTTLQCLQQCIKDLNTKDRLIVTEYIIKNILQTVTEIHKLGLSHNDLKFDNILIEFHDISVSEFLSSDDTYNIASRLLKSLKFNVIICDFGLTGKLGVLWSFEDFHVSDLKKGEIVTERNDIYAIIFLWEIMWNKEKTYANVERPKSNLKREGKDQLISELYDTLTNENKSETMDNLLSPGEKKDITTFEEDNKFLYDKVVKFINRYSNNKMIEDDFGGLTTFSEIWSIISKQKDRFLLFSLLAHTIQFRLDILMGYGLNIESYNKDFFSSFGVRVNSGIIKLPLDVVKLICKK